MPSGNYEADTERQERATLTAVLETSKALLRSAPFDAYRRYMSDANDADRAAVQEWQDAVARLCG